MVVYTLVFSSLSDPVIDLHKMPILAKKKIIFSDKAHFDLDGNVNKQNCLFWGTENPHACIEKPTHPKRSLSGHVERIFIHKNWRGGYWQHLFPQDGATCHTAEATFDVLRPLYEDRIISCRVDVVWPPRSWDLTTLDYYLLRAVKDKC